MGKTERLEARVAPADAERIRLAAKARHLSAGAFMVEAARARADEVLVEQTETVVSSAYFDQLLEALDDPPELIPALAKVAEAFPEHQVTRR